MPSYLRICTISEKEDISIFGLATHTLGSCEVFGEYGPQLEGLNLKDPKLMGEFKIFQGLC